MRAQASLRLGNVRGTTPELLGSYRGSVCLLSVAPCVAFGALVWPGKRDSPPRPPLLPRNAGTAEPFRVSPPEAVAYQLELDTVRFDITRKGPRGNNFLASFVFMQCRSKA